MRILGPVVAALVAASLLTSANPAKAENREVGIQPYLTLSAGGAFPAGSLASAMNAGGGVVVGAGLQLTPMFGVEGEFVGAWASSVIGLNGGVYNGFFGPRITLPIADDGLAFTAGGGIGVTHTTFGGIGLGTRFGWQVKGGLEFPVGEALALLLDVRYGAAAEASGDGVVGLSAGIRWGGN